MLFGVNELEEFRNGIFTTHFHLFEMFSCNALEFFFLQILWILNWLPFTAAEKKVVKWYLNFVLLL